MPRHQIFLVHGMGQFERGWSSSTAQLLNQVFSNYTIPKAMGLDTAFDYPEITYSAVFDKWRDQWRQDAKDIAGKLKSGGLASSMADDLNNVATSVSGDGFLQTHVLDVLFWRFIRPMAEEVTLEVLTQIDKHLTSFGGQPAEYSVICHSLGTSVMYESLHSGLTDQQHLLSSRLPKRFIAVSNCTRLLWGKGGDVYTSKMGPSPLSHKGMCDQFFDFGHALDPVWQVSPFHSPPNGPPQSWFPDPVLTRTCYLHDAIAAEDIQEINVHALSHSLGHPAVHVPLIRSFINDPEAVSQSDFDAALAAWQAMRLDKQALTKAKQKLKALGSPMENDWKAITDTIAKLRKTITGLKKYDGEN
jgi:hypothetical protein